MYLEQFPYSVDFAKTHGANRAIVFQWLLINAPVPDMTPCFRATGVTMMEAQEAVLYLKEKELAAYSERGWEAFIPPGLLANKKGELWNIFKSPSYAPLLESFLKLLKSKARHKDTTEAELLSTFKTKSEESVLQALKRSVDNSFVTLFFPDNANNAANVKATSGGGVAGTIGPIGQKASIHGTSRFSKRVDEKEDSEV